jgi:hypothetical protein
MLKTGFLCFLRRFFRGKGIREAIVIWRERSLEVELGSFGWFGSIGRRCNDALPLAGQIQALNPCAKLGSAQRQEKRLYLRIETKKPM